MEEKKLTDEEIVKALEICSKELDGCNKCPVKEPCCDAGNAVLLLYALDLIRRLQAKNERLKIDLENEKNWSKIQTKQAVKDVANKIWNDVTSYYFSLRVIGNATVELDKLAEFWHKRGVEAE